MGKHGADRSLALIFDGPKVVHPDAVENLAEFSRTFLERCGNRSSLDVAIICLVACRLAPILVNGTRLEDVGLALSDLYVHQTPQFCSLLECCFFTSD